MPLPETVRDYQALREHVERLHDAVFHEKWQDVEALWFDHFALHKRLGKPTPTDKPRIQAVLERMDEITRLLNERKQDIALLLRISP